ncbi:MAG: hypothetical protein ACYTGW_02815 [Planctomycetota bacterium]|jgi:hypothetical protein
MTQPSQNATRDEGSVLLVTLILMLGLGSLASASLAVMVSQNRTLVKRHRARQVELIAEGQLELAKNMVNASSYNVHMENMVLRDALSAPNQIIPNTEVRVEQIGGTMYYKLSTEATWQGITKSAEAIVRQTSPASSNNLMVIDHPVGISGAPRGTIHSNRYIDFYFPGGNYVDQVTASDGFNFVAGAKLENTTFSGPVNPNAPSVNPLKDIVFDDLWTKADLLAVTDDYISEVEFKGDLVEIKLFKPAYEEKVKSTRTKTVFSHYETEYYTISKPVYEDYTYTEIETKWKLEYYTEIDQKPVYAWRDATRTKTRSIYENRTVEYTVDVPVYGTRKVQEEYEDYVWISYESVDSASSSGGTVGATGSAPGYWKKMILTREVDEAYITGFKTERRTRVDKVKIGKETYEETYSQKYVDHYEDVEVTRSRWVEDGTREVEKTGRRIVAYEDVTKSRKIKKYKTITKTFIKKIKHREEYVRTETIPVGGTIFLQGDVRKLAGKLDGRISLITAGEVKITNDLVYVDADGDSRMLNGKDYTKPYVDNPDYNGTSLLAVMAKGDIKYSTKAPSQLEINASLISADGSVKFDGIGVSKDGSDVWTEYSDGKDHVLTSLRRLGGIVSYKRPIATYIDEKGMITAGFEFGESIMDQNLILSNGTNAAPPFMFESSVPVWIMSTTGLTMGIIY